MVMVPDIRPIVPAPVSVKGAPAEAEALFKDGLRSGGDHEECWQNGSTGVICHSR